MRHKILKINLTDDEPSEESRNEASVQFVENTLVFVVHEILGCFHAGRPFGPSDVLVDAMETLRLLEEPGSNHPLRSTVTSVARNPTYTDCAKLVLADVAYDSLLSGW